MITSNVSLWFCIGSMLYIKVHVHVQWADLVAELYNTMFHFQTKKKKVTEKTLHSVNSLFIKNKQTNMKVLLWFKNFSSKEFPSLIIILFQLFNIQIF